jgi:predicted  nucleic acid-binding Zn-ribbon protein
VLKHERFEELCASASVGQASGEELAQLREHLGWCSQCQERYSEFLAINAAQYATIDDREELSKEEAVNSIDSTLFRERFLEKAAAEGIVFSPDKTERPLPAPQIQLKCRFWPVLVPRLTGAFAVVIALSGAAYYVTLQRSRAHDRSNSATIVSHNSESEEQTREAQDKIAALSTVNRDLTKEIDTLQEALASQRSTISQLQSRSSLSENDRLALLAQLRAKQKLNQDLQARVEQADTEITNLRARYQQAQSTADNYQATLVEDQVKIREISDQLADNTRSLDRERDMLAASRDIRELMAAKNLHIVDVSDTDPKGKTRPAFGRIFFTEGKSLLFYAYDMPDTRLKEAGYHYEIWGKKEGLNQRARSLGIFFSDDKTQKRWVFQYADPKVLNEIDSVFVTLEHSNNSNQPKGEKLLYAYLKGQANHP